MFHLRSRSKLYVPKTLCFSALGGRWVAIQAFMLQNPAFETAFGHFVLHPKKQRCVFGLGKDVMELPGAVER